MYWLIFTQMLWAAAPPQPSVLCHKNHQASQDKINHELKKGLPIEVVGVLSEQQNIVCKSVVNMSLDLWEEKVRFTGSHPGKVSLEKLMPELCLRVSCEGQGDRFRILLNPLWEGRVAKLLSNSPQLRDMRYYHFDPKSISKNLPSEIVVLDQEISSDP